jgi:hypothetical protein
VGVAYLFPTFGFPLWWTSLKSGVEQFQTAENLEKNRLLLWLSLPLMLGFTLMGGYRPILPTWAMPGFWGATLLLGWRAVAWQQRSPRGVRRWLWGSGLVIAALLLVALLHLTLGTLQRPSQYAWFGGVIPARADASVQLVDIQQIRHGFVDSPKLSNALQQSDFVFTNEIFLAGQVAMALAPLNSPPILCFNEDLRGFAFWSTAQEWVGKSGLYVTSTRQASEAPFVDYFKQIEKIGEIPIQRGGVTIEVIQVYQAHNLLKPYPRSYGKTLTDKALR